MSAEQRQLELQEFVDTVKGHTQELNHEYWRYITRTNKQPIALSKQSTLWEVYLKWHEYYLEQSDKIDFTGLDGKKPIIASETDIFKSFEKLQKPKQAKWNMRLSSKVTQKLKGMGRSVINVLEYIFALQLGYMNDSQVLDTGPIMYLAFFSKMIKGGQALIYCVAPERVPVVRDVNGKVQIQSLQCRQYLRIIDIVNHSEKDKNKYGAYEGFLGYIQSDPDKFGAFLPSSYLDKTNHLRQDVELFDITNIVQVVKGPLYLPLLNQVISLSPIERKTFQFVGGRWISESEQSKFSYQVTSNMKSLNREIIAKCTSSESCEWLLKFLQKIPNFKLKLTPEEELLIATPGNVLCLGRSGTGKTTSAVLRLFALEILFKIRSNLMMNKGEQGLKDSRLSSEDAENACGLHSVIVTASPVLTNEIRRFYTNLKQRIISELQKREKIKKAKAEAERMGKIFLKEELKVDEEQAQDQEKEQEPDINEDEILDMEELEKNLKFPHSMSEMRNESFPAFLTVKRLVYMIDASLNRPFFARNLKNEIIGLDSQAEWHNEQKGILMINNYFKTNEVIVDKYKQNEEDQLDLSSSEDEFEFEAEEYIEQVKQQVQKSKRKKQRHQQDEQVVQEFAQEIDFETFERKFWPKVQFSYKNLTPATCWMEIFSVIKGSYNSGDFAQLALPIGDYQMKKSFLDENEKRRIYQVYTQYEQWKKQVKGFDFMDLVNHILREIQGLKYFGVPIHFMLVDEVQDLTAATIKLLLKVTEQNVYFAGDTAQTIAKGVGFRFCDLKSMLNLSDFQAPKVLQLTTNFRSHNKILNLANSVISAVELFFPMTIDKLKKERSNVDGLKPIVLDSNLLDSLFYILLGKTQSQDKSNSSLLSTKQGGGAEFGCDQVIIVRDQESKKKVPSVLQHALCLTVFEAKGLEFEDVILFNFFTDSQVQDQWKLMNQIQIEAIKVRKQSNKLQDIDELDYENEGEEEVKAEEKEEQKLQSTEYEYANRFYLADNIRAPNYQKMYSGFCNELKQLYVCITRPKKRLIIYDEDPECREVMIKFWKKVDAIDVITEDMLTKESSNMSPEEQALFEKLKESRNEDTESKDWEAVEAKKKGWRLQGIKMFKRRFYEQAMKCFEHAGDKELQQRSLGYSLADQASKLSSESEALSYKLTDNSQTLSKHERRELRTQIEELKASSRQRFKMASDIFLSINLKKQAAQCLYTAEYLIEAAQVFEEIGFYSQAGEVHYLLGDFQRAARLYNEGKMVSKAVDCYKQLKNWDAILACIKQNEQEFTQEQRQKLIMKYVPLALNSLYSVITNDQFVENDDVEEEEQPKNKKILGLKGQVIEKDYEVDTLRRSKIIEEESSEEEKEEEEEVKQGKNVLNEGKYASKGEVESVHSIEENNTEEVEQIDTSSKKTKKKMESSEVFSVISESDAKIESEKQAMSDSFEHLSQFDPEDEFLKSRTISVIDSVISGEYKQGSKKSELSDFSIISMNPDKKLEDPALNKEQETREIILENVNKIQTKRDIYAEDIMMSKIIHYVSQFSLDVQQYLSQLRSKDVLFSNKSKENPAEEQFLNEEDAFQIDMDSLSEDFLNTLLDCLEGFELYKLCLIICNRYNMVERLGRYLVSIAYKYSNLSETQKKLVTLFHATHKEVQQQVSFISHQAMHSAFEIIDPKYLQINGQNVLGQYFYTAMLNLGLWKKLVYIVDVKSGLSISSMFAEFSSFRQLYLAFYDKGHASSAEIKSMLETNSFDFVSEVKIPENEIHVLAMKTALDSILWTVGDDITLPLSVDFPVQFKLTEIVLMVQKKQCPSSAVEEILTEIDSRMTKIVNNLKVEREAGEYLNQCYIYDTFVALFLLVKNAFKGRGSMHVNVLSTLPLPLQIKLIKVLNQVSQILKFNNIKISSIDGLPVILEAILTTIKAKPIPQCPALYDNFGDKVIMHWSSPIAMELTNEIEQRKQQLTDSITKQVFADPEFHLLLKRDVQQRIKTRLREAFEKEALDQIIEIIDMDANFIRVPLKVVVNKIVNRLQSYLKYNTFQMATSNSTFNNYKEIDQFETPFEVSKKLNYLIEHYNIAGETLQVFEQTGIVQVLKQEIISKAKGEDHLLYHIKNEETIKTEHKMEHYRYLLELGLVTQNYVDRQKKKLYEKNHKLDQLQLNQKRLINNIKALALIRFEPLSDLNTVSRASILELAQNYWSFYLETVTSGEKNGYIKLAIISLSLYILTDDYLYFLESVQRALPNGSLDKKLLLNLLDAHIYRKCGDLLTSSRSLATFMSTLRTQDIEITLHYETNYLQMALVQALCLKQNFYIPYELAKFMPYYLDNISESDKQEFLDQVSIFNAGDSVPFTLKFNNTNSLSVYRDEDRNKYESLINDLVDHTCYLINTVAKTDYQLTHLYLTLFALIVNEPRICSQNKKDIDQALTTFYNNGLIYEDHCLYSQYGPNALLEFAEEFKNLGSDEQNSVLYIHVRSEDAQSAFINVSIQTDSELKADLDMIIQAKLKAAEEYEDVQTTLHQNVASLVGQQMKQRRERAVVGKKKKALMSMDNFILLKNLGASQVSSKNIQEMIAKVASLSRFIRAVSYNSTFENVLDLHYLLQKKHKIETEIIYHLKQLLDCGDQRVKDTELAYYQELIQDIKNQVEIWSQNKYIANKRVVEKHKKIMKLKWKEHAQRIKQKMIQKVTGRKKEEALMLKKARLKGKVLQL